jgi:hypothetical protein
VAFNVISIFLTPSSGSPFQAASRTDRCRIRRHNYSIQHNAVFWDVTPCRACVNRRFGGTYRSLQPPPLAGSSLAGFSTLKMGTKHSSETSVHTRSTRRHIPEDCILHRHRLENLKSYLFHTDHVPTNRLLRTNHIGLACKVLSYEIYRRFGGTCCLYLQDPRVSQTHKQQGVISFLVVGYLLCVLLDPDHGSRTLLRSVYVFLAVLASLTLP